MFTMDPLAPVKVPIPVVVNVPPRFTVPPVAASVPVLLQAPDRFSVALVSLNVPPLLQFVELMDSVVPEPALTTPVP
jgi:hypothetical protein